MFVQFICMWSKFQLPQMKWEVIIAHVWMDSLRQIQVSPQSASILLIANLI